MQKKIIALAVAAAASGAALAQSNVQIYGQIDVNYMSRGGDSGQNAGAVNRSEIGTSGSGSRIGFKGTEDLGNGLKALFQYEFGLTADQATGTTTGSSNAAFTNRNSYVGLTGNFGTVVAGRLNGVRYGLYGKYDAFANYGLGNFAQMTTQYDRADNAVAYISPSFAGFELTLAHSRHTGGGNLANFSSEGTWNGTANNLQNPLVCGGTAALPATSTCRSNTGDDVLFTAKLGYTNGAFAADIDYETTTRKDIDVEGNRLYVLTTGASYDFGFMKLSGLYDIIKGQSASTIGGNVAGTAPNRNYDRRNWLISALVPVNAKVDVKATYGRVSDRTNGSNAALVNRSTAAGTFTPDMDAAKFGLGVDYKLSKRTNLYANYAKIKNDDNAFFALSPAGNTQGTGYGVQGYEFGIIHKF